MTTLADNQEHQKYIKETEQKFNFDSELSETEKYRIISRTLYYQKTKGNTVKDVSGHLFENFKRIDGVDSRWSSLITSYPMLFEDLDYYRARDYVESTITQKELQAYKDGKLRKLYPTFEALLMDNLQYYERIMCFCTMIFCKYYRVDMESIGEDMMDTIPLFLSMTPTQVWCCALTSTESTEFELKYAWETDRHRLNFEPYQNDKPFSNPANYKLVYSNPNKLFKTFCIVRHNISGMSKGDNFRNCFLQDKTNNQVLAHICRKFTRTSTAMSEMQLNNLYNFHLEQERINNLLYDALKSSMDDMFGGYESEYAIYVYNTEFYIHTSKFSMRVAKDEKGKITKEYQANSIECFSAEAHLASSIKQQIEWAKFKLPYEFAYDRNILVTLLSEMLKENYKSVLCVKRMPRYSVTSKIQFSGIFNNVYVKETFMFENRVLKETKFCLSKEKAAMYVINRGYTLFGYEKDVLQIDTFNSKTIVQHFTKYCVPVYHYMKDIIKTYQNETKEAIDFMLTGKIPEGKLNMSALKFTHLENINEKRIFSGIFERQKKRNDEMFAKTTSYWQIKRDYVMQK